jgi:hypothetical protein
MVEKDKINDKDVGLIEDALYTIRNLCAWEDHLARHIDHLEDEKDKLKFLKILERVRIRRSLIMDLVVTENPSHSEYCQTKHASNASTGFIELANRFITLGDTKKALRSLKESRDCEEDIFEINNIKMDQEESISEA